MKYIVLYFGLRPQKIYIHIFMLFIFKQGKNVQLFASIPF